MSNSPSQFDRSFLLFYALHYEVKLMRKVWDFFKSNRYQRRRDRRNDTVSKDAYVTKLKSRAFILLHKNHLNHYGHKFAKEQADTARQFFLTRKMLNKWKVLFKERIQQKFKIEVVQGRLNSKTMLKVFVEWHQITVAHMIHNVKRHTAKQFYESQVMKKGFLSLKFFTKYNKKQAYMKQISRNYEVERVARKVIWALRQPVENQKHKLEKINIA